MSINRQFSSAQPSSDAELLREVSAGDLHALGDLYDRYADDVWRAVRRIMWDGADVDDILHATFLNLPRIAALYDGRTSCRNWLRGIAVNLGLRHRRGMGRFRRMLGGFAHTQTATDRETPEQRVSRSEELVVLERAITCLSEKKREVFVLIELEGLSTDEVAKALELPAATVRTRLFNARRELQAALGEKPDRSWNKRIATAQVRLTPG